MNLVRLGAGVVGLHAIVLGAVICAHAIRLHVLGFVTGRTIRLAGGVALCGAGALLIRMAVS